MCRLLILASLVLQLAFAWESSWKAAPEQPLNSGGSSWWNQQPLRWNTQSKPIESETVGTNGPALGTTVGFGLEQPPYNSSAVDRILHVLGFRRNVCPFGAIPFVRNSAGQMFEDKYQICDPRSIAACPAGYVCDRSRYRQYHICCASYDGSTVSKTSATHPATTHQHTTSKITWAPWSPTTSTEKSTTTRPVTTATEKPTTTTSTTTTTTTAPPTTSTASTTTTVTAIPTIARTTVTPAPTTAAPTTEKSETTETPTTRPPTTTISEAPTTPTPDVTAAKTKITKKPTLPPTTTFLVPTTRKSVPEIIQLTSGSIVKLGHNEWQWATSITIIKDDDKYFMVDAGVPADTNALIRELSRNGLSPDDIDCLILTHAHPDHVGNLNVFSTKHQIFYEYEYIGNRFKLTELVNSPSKQISSNIELWKTPGHSQQDLTVIVRRVPSFGTVAVVGDLIMTEDFLKNPDHFLDISVWNTRVQWENVKTVVCAADWVIPGHGPMFRITDDHRLKAECTEPAYVYSPFRRFSG